jgi:hypothetical protein
MKIVGFDLYSVGNVNNITIDNPPEVIQDWFKKKYGIIKDTTIESMSIIETDEVVISDIITK